MERIVRIGVRFLDNVIDTSGYPLRAQHDEQETKRRTGLGITGLGNALAMMKLRYGTESSLHFTETVMQKIKETAYDESTNLAEERGPFPFYDPDQWGKESAVVQSLPSRIRDKIQTHGIRNGVLLTIAPTGTTSLYMGNCSSGLEPVFLLETERKVLQADGSHETFIVRDYGYEVFKHVHGDKMSMKDHFYMVTHEHLAVKDHIRIQAVCQSHIDASVSKTINCPEGMSYEEFKLMYWDAYNSSCKGCTTYRPSEVRGSVLGTSKPKQPKPIERPPGLQGWTYKIRWPNTDASYYITINELDGKPFEMFISSTSGTYSDWTTALSLMISAIMRLGYDISFVPQELMKVQSYNDQAWVGRKRYGSLVALIGDTLGKHLSGDVEISEVDGEPPQADFETKVPLYGQPTAPKTLPSVVSHTKMETCPKCNQQTLISQEGCKTCLNCGFSNCG